MKNILSELNIVAQCRKYNLPLLQCPQFLFLIMGLITIGANILAYLIGSQYIENPLMVAFIVLILSVVLMIISFTITRSFERLAEAVRMKSEFISVVSHELRSPLSNLRWAIELLLTERLGEFNQKQREYFTILEENTNRMNDLVSELVVVSKIQQRKLPLNEKKFSFNELVKKAMSGIEPFAKASNVEMELEAEKLPKIKGDPQKIKLAIENLLDNSIRYIEDQGKVKIRIKKKRNDIFFQVKDNGVGIPEQEQKYLFKKFFRAENARRRDTKGSGLGLFIAKSLVERSGGTIGFTSKKGKGSTFWFTLPIK